MVEMYPALARFRCLVERCLTPLQRLPFPAFCLVVGFFLNVCSFILYAPPLFLNAVPDSRILDVVRMAEHPFRRDLNEPILYFRLTLPVLAHILGLRAIWSVYLLQVLFNWAFLSALFAVFASRISRKAGLVATACFAFSQAAQTGNAWLGVQDPVTNLSVCVLMLSVGTWVSGVTMAGLLADERAVLALPFVILWHWVGEDPEGPPQNRRALRALTTFALGAAGAFVIRQALRAGLMGPGVPEPTVYKGIAANIGSPLRQVFDYPLSALFAPVFAFKFLWILPAFVLTRVFVPRVRVLVWLTLVALGAGTLIVTFGGDWTRSVAFMFPAFVWMVPVLVKETPVARNVLLLVLAGMLLSPQVFVDPTRGGWIRPLPVVLLQMARS